METVKTKENGLFPTMWSDFFGNEPFFAPRWLTSDVKETLPAANVRETKKAFIVDLAMPGFAKEDFVIDADDNVLNVRAEKQEETSDEDEHFTRREFSCKSFARSFTLPENVNCDAIEAKYSKGILELNIPKKEASKALPKKEIKVI